MNSRDYYLITITAVAITLFASVPRLVAVESKTSSAKAALVNEAVIFKNDLDRDVTLILRKLKDQEKDVPEDQLPGIRKKALEDLINRELLYQESRKQKFSVDPHVIDEQFELIKNMYSNEKIFSDKLSFMDLSESEMKSQIEKNLIVRRFINENLARGILVSEEESRAFYKKNMKKFRQAEKIRAGHILIKVSPDAPQSEKIIARKKIETILKRIRNGEKFSDLAKKFSEGPAGEAGGELGYIEQKNMAQPFSDAAFSLNTGKTSEIIETPAGFHLIQVTDKKPERDSTYEEAKIEIDRLLAQKKLNENIKSCLEELRQNAGIEIFEETTASKTKK
ncbi:MAG: peptidylprolyl isomerase [Desulfobacterales bacterium]